jgi:hypothetical protein
VDLGFLFVGVLPGAFLATFLAAFLRRAIE